MIQHFAWNKHKLVFVDLPVPVDFADLDGPPFIFASPSPTPDLFRWDIASICEKKKHKPVTKVRHPTHD